MSATTCSLSSPIDPDFVVINITPLAARLPYKAAEEASFNTEIDSMSFGLISDTFPPIGTPSTT